MPKTSFTAFEEADINARTKDAMEYLKSKGLMLAAVVQKVNQGDSIFVDQVIPYLQDTVHSGKDDGIPTPYHEPDID